MTAPAAPIIISAPSRNGRADGWESLGDIGRLDADGYLYLGDRLADMILRGGAQHLSGRDRGRGIGASARAFPASRSVLPDPEFGQRVHAIVELGPDTDAQAVSDGMGDFPRRPAQAATSTRKALK